jgi:transcriptional regulator with XRE-family HTH domain
MPTTLGSLVRESRIARKWSLKELGEKLESTRGAGAVSPQFLNDVEHGRRVPSEEMLAQMAAALSLELDILRSLAGRSSPNVEEYLAKHAETSSEVARVFRKAIESGFTDWKKVEGIVEPPKRRKRA